MTVEYDYVIAGGGSAGCVLASRLAENSSTSVCLVEAGGKGRDIFIKMPAGNGFWVVKLGRAPLPITRGRMGSV